MPQVPSPNMGIIWPTDGDDVNVWAPIMDTAVRVTIDGHNHSAGSGAPISIGSLKFDTDISFVDALGGKHAITNLKTISFFPSPPPVGTNGSFFIADGTSGTVANELYYRTTLGTNVQVTTGGTLNVAGFAGGIGGDYNAVQALESYLDAQNAYQFFQQLGAGVRQFAKLQSADLSLFEFKAHGTAGVPTQAVTLKSPAALALGYSITMPTALSASAQSVSIDAAGQAAIGASQELATNNSYTVSGTGLHKHGPKTINKALTVMDAVLTAGSFTSVVGAQTTPGVGLGTATVFIRLPDLPSYARVLGVTIGFGTALERNGCTAQLTRSTSGDPATTVFTNVGAALSNAGTAQLSVSGLTATPGSGETFWLKVVNGGAGNANVVSMTVSYDIP